MTAHGPAADNKPTADQPVDPAAVLALAPEIKERLCAEAAVWEETFDAGPGLVMSVSDAAHVAARWLLERHPPRQQGRDVNFLNDELAAGDQ